MSGGEDSVSLRYLESDFGYFSKAVIRSGVIKKDVIFDRTEITTTGTVTGGTLTDGTATITGGTVTGTTLTDGTATLTNGTLTGNIDGDVTTEQITSENLKIISPGSVELLEVKPSGLVKGQGTQTDVVADTLRPYVNNESQGIIYLSFEDPTNLARDFSKNGRNGVVLGGVSYQSNVTDSNGVTMKHVARIQGSGNSNRIDLDEFAAFDIISSVSFWFRVDSEETGDIFLFHLGDNFPNQPGVWQRHWTVQFISDGRIRQALRTNSPTIRGETFTPAGIDFRDGKWHFGVFTIGGPNNSRFWVDGTMYGPTTFESELGSWNISTRNRMSLCVPTTGPPVSFVDYSEFTLWYNRMEDIAEHPLIQQSQHLGRHSAHSFHTTPQGFFSAGSDHSLRMWHNDTSAKIETFKGKLQFETHDDDSDGDMEWRNKNTTLMRLDATDERLHVEKLTVTVGSSFPSGTFNTKITDGSVDFVMTSSTLKLTRIGPLIFLEGRIEWSSKNNMPAASNLRITLPHNSDGDWQNLTTNNFVISAAENLVFVQPFSVGNTSTCFFKTYNSNGNTRLLRANDVFASGSFDISGFYKRI